MAMGRKGPVQQPLFVRTDELAGAPRHRFYDTLNELLDEAGFDALVEELCAPYFAKDGEAGRISTPPGAYFRMLFIGYFEGIESERGICWRCEDSLSLRAFIGYTPHGVTPDHSTLSRMRSRLGAEVYEKVFHFVMSMLNRKGLLRGRVAGVDSTYLKADASMKTIVRRGSGEDYKSYLKGLAKKAGYENPTDEDARRLDRTRKKRTSNKEWKSPTDADAEITRMKDGTTRLAYKAEHAVDMDSGAILNAEILPATTSDGESVLTSVEHASENIEAARDDDDDDDNNTGASVVVEKIVEVVGDKGFHKASTIREFADRGIRTYFPERLQHGDRHWQKNGGRHTALAVYQNRKRLTSAKSKRLQRRRGELVERTFAHLCETGAGRRTRLRGRANVQKRYVIQAAAFNLSLVMRKLLGHGTPRGLSGAVEGLFALLTAMIAALLYPLGLIVPPVPEDRANLDPFRPIDLPNCFSHSSTGC